MKQTVRRVAGATATAAIATIVIAGCSDDNNSSSAASSASAAVSSAVGAASSAMSSAGGTVELTAADGAKVSLTGPIAAKYTAATEKEKTDLGAPLTGEGTSGTSASGVVFQQFTGGVITAKNGDASTPAYITWGKIRDAWNVKRGADGTPAADGKSGSNGPLGAATSDETAEGTVKTSTFEHGKITWDSGTDKVEVTIDGKVVPTQ